jgi:predicted nucleic acid-binding protein
MKKAIVVDTSLAIKWVLKEADSEAAEALLLEWSQNEVVVYAPPLLAYEIANALFKNVRKGEISIERAKGAFAEILLSGIELDFPQDHALSLRALELAQKYALPATYDTHYLALAERENCELWTADSRMWRTLQGKLPWVRNLSDYRPDKSKE